MNNGFIAEMKFQVTKTFFLRMGFLAMATLGLYAANAQESKDWEISMQQVDPPDDGPVKSELTFSPPSESGKKKIVYLPKDLPFGETDHKKIILEGKAFFLTQWSNGATVLYRVFYPEVRGKEVLCKPFSFIEDLNETKLRLDKDNLMIQVQQDQNSPPEWLKCHQITSEKSWKKTKKPRLSK